MKTAEKVYIQMFAEEKEPQNVRTEESVVRIDNFLKRQALRSKATRAREDGRMEDYAAIQNEIFQLTLV